jgi:acetolactate synthase-1/2/3 large subunit
MSIFDSIAQTADGVAFGIPGGGPSLDVADAIERSGGRFYTVRFEGAAALMAGAVGRLTGSPGIAVTIKGPGLANLVSGLATCALEDLPVLAIAEAFGKEDAPARAHKRIDHGRLTNAIIKGRAGITEPGVVSTLKTLATAERPGPVLLELAQTDIELAKPASISPRAQRPVVIAGSLAVRRGWTPLLNALRIPVFTTAAAKGAVDESLPHAAGVYTGVGLSLAPEITILTDADLIIGLGLRSHEVLSTSLKLPAINIDDVDAAPGFSFAALGSVHLASEALAGLQSHSGWGSDVVGSAIERLRRTLLAGPFLPAHAFERVAQRWPRARMVLDTGFFCTVGEHIWQALDPDLYLSSGQARSMGAALPMALGAAIIRREEPTILAVGDGGIGMFFTELILAVEEQLPLLIVLMRDGTYSSVRDRAVVKGLTQRPLTITNPDWVAVASALGFKADRVKSADELSLVLATWQPADGPALVEVGFDPEPYRLMTRELRG